MGCVADLPPEKLEEFRGCSATAIYKARQVIFLQGTPATGLYILCHGSVKLYQSDRFGHDLIIGVAVPGDVLGEMPLDPLDLYSVSAEALTETQLCYLPRDRLVDFINMHPLTGVRLIAALSRALGAARKKAGGLALKSAETRLAELLVQLAQAANHQGNHATQVTLTYSRREIGEMIGVSTETAIRLLGRFKRRGMLVAHGRDLIIVDVDKLARLAEHMSLNVARVAQPSIPRDLPGD
jgi:CRP/FNR family transcriptional regulator